MNFDPTSYSTLFFFYMKVFICVLSIEIFVAFSRFQHQNYPTTIFVNFLGSDILRIPTQNRKARRKVSQSYTDRQALKIQCTGIKN